MGMWRIGQLTVTLFALALLLPSAAFTGASGAPGHPGSGPAGGHLASAGPPAPDWTTFHGSENRSGYTPFSGPSVLEEGWSRCPTGLSIRAGPVADPAAIYVVSTLGTVYALNRSHNESILWSLDLQAEPVDVDVSDPYLLVGTTAGGIVALFVSNGTPAWSAGLGSGIVQGVSIANATVYVGTVSGAVWAMDLVTGVTEWRTVLPSAIGGALSIDAGTIFAPTLGGSLYALSTSGSIEWSSPVGASIETAVAVSNGLIVVGDARGNVSALYESSGDLAWRWVGGPNDSVHATPSIGEGRVFVLMDSERVVALGLSNGSLAWVTPAVYAGGYISTSAPALTPTGLYVVINGYQDMIDLRPSDGRLKWTSYAFYDFAFSSPAIIGADVVVAVDNGCVVAYGPTGAAPTWPVTGVVRTAGGSPLAGVVVTLDGSANTTGADGRFLVVAPNGSYLLTAILPNFGVALVPILVVGALANLSIVLEPWVVYPVSGIVVDQGSAKGVPGALVEVIVGSVGYEATTTTGPDGSFTIPAPNGSVFLSVAPPAAYGGVSIRFNVSGAPRTGVVVYLTPVALTIEAGAAWYAELFFFGVPLAALALGTLAVRVRQVSRRREAEGLPPAVLSPFGRYVLMRLGLLPGQVAIALAVLFAFGTVFRDVSLNVSPCALSTSACSVCDWSNLACSLRAILEGYWQFLSNLFSGNWGYASYGHLREPVSLFLTWWLPASIELAVISLAIALAAAYPLGLIAGWHRGGAVDLGARAGALIGLFMPTFVVALLLLYVAYSPFLSHIGDAPYGLVPSPNWYTTHGGIPGWIGLGGNTLPTGMPVIDGALHRDWPFEEVVLAKVLLQAAIVGVVYIAVFLRYARNIVVDAARDLHVSAARARGVDEGTLLWHHTARRVLPFYLLVFALTLPVFIGTQALVEVVFSDNGVGTVLFAGITALATSRTGLIGFSGGQTAAGGFEQVAVFLLLLIVLSATLFADIIARWLEPSRREEGR
ncbi:MAG: PQQ-binding-like beta-propeller repeat protein [Thermoplasmata archaeon]|nr:PQQ-binding-like beta-propeller repeat protein [Thermoplasmata archaeon]